MRSFLLQVAADFFRKEGPHSDKFGVRKQELAKIEFDRQKREKLVATKKKNLVEELDEFFRRVSSGAPQEESLELSERVSKKLQEACKIKDTQNAAREVMQVEKDAHIQLQNIESRYRIPRPRIALSKAMQRDWRDYSVAHSKLSETVFRPTRELIEDLVGDEATKARLEMDRRLRVEAALDELAKQARKKTREGRVNVQKEAEHVVTKVRSVASECIGDVEKELRTVISEFQRTDTSGLTDGDFVNKRDNLESRILKVTDDRSQLLESLLEQLQTIDLSGKTSMLDQLVAVEQRNLLLEEEANADLQLAQLGMAVEIINHEFNATVRSLRNNLRRLKAWADINKDLEELYRNIRASFDHLDGYLTLFTPLQRRLYRKAVDIRGSEIYDFLNDLFKERLARHHIQLGQTEVFSEAQIRSFPSSFYPVFVNLVDNAIYWLSQQNPSIERQIELDAANGDFLISNSGPVVDRRDSEAIFEFGFTRKPGGRGMGLHISREVLRRVDYDLKLMDETNAKGTTFVIRPKNIRSRGQRRP